MKIEYNIPVINKVKRSINNIKGKIKSNKINVNKKSDDNNSKMQYKYYALLILMLALGIISLTYNAKEYNKSTKEKYEEYSFNNNEDNNIIASESSDKIYITDQSSIKTEEACSLETLSSNVLEKFDMPVEGDIIKDFATERLVYSNTLQMWKTHPGIDIKAELNSYVKSISNGTVISIEKDSFYGKTVKVKYNDYIFIYSNLDDDITCKENHEIKKGDIIGKIGITAEGELMDESHLHFEVLENDLQINPVQILKITE